jgi:hypothetical protein
VQWWLVQRSLQALCSACTTGSSLAACTAHTMPVRATVHTVPVRVPAPVAMVDIVAVSLSAVALLISPVAASTALNVTLPKLYFYEPPAITCIIL